MTLKQNIIGFFTMLGRLPIKLLVQEWLYVRDCFIDLWQALKNRQWLAVLRGIASLLGIFFTYISVTFFIMVIISVLVHWAESLHNPFYDDYVVKYLFPPLALLCEKIPFAKYIIISVHFPVVVLCFLITFGLLPAPLALVIISCISYLSIQVRLYHAKVSNETWSLWYRFIKMLIYFLVTMTILVDIPYYIEFPWYGEVPYYAQFQPILKHSFLDFSARELLGILGLPLAFIVYMVYEGLQKKDIPQQQTKPWYKYQTTPLFFMFCMVFTALLNLILNYIGGTSEYTSMFCKVHLSNFKVLLASLKLSFAIWGLYLLGQWCTHKAKQLFRKPS
jgi:hypothetical protein